MDSESRHQFELLPQEGAPHVEPVTPELIRSIKKRQTFLAAWNFAQDFAALQDKQVYDPLGVDSSHWTKIRKGTASPPGDERFNRYLDLVQNEIPLIWWVESRGYDWTTLRKHRSAEQRRIAELEEENQRLRSAIVVWAQAEKGRLA